MRQNHTARKFCAEKSTRAVSIHSLQERTHVLQDEACRDSMTGLLTAGAGHYNRNAEAGGGFSGLYV